MLPSAYNPNYSELSISFLKKKNMKNPPPPPPSL